MPKEYKEEFVVGDFVKINPTVIDSMVSSDENSVFKNFYDRIFAVKNVVPNKEFCYVLEEVPYIFSYDELVKSQSLIKDRDLEEELDKIDNSIKKMEETDMTPVYSFDGKQYNDIYSFAESIIEKYGEEQTMQVLCEAIEELSDEVLAYNMFITEIQGLFEDLGIRLKG